MIYEKTEDFYLQKIHMINVTETRFDFFKNLCKDKKVLHIGCADAMVYGPGHNLHIKLIETASELHGMDVNKEDLQKLQEAYPGTYFSNFETCDQEYDIVIVPEVLEHVINAKEFLDQIFVIKSKEVFISVPNILHYQKEMTQEDEYAFEIVHPDHKYWFSPYTLFNITQKYIMNEERCRMYYLDGKSMIGIYINQQDQNAV